MPNPANLQKRNVMAVTIQKVMNGFLIHNIGADDGGQQIPPIPPSVHYDLAGVVDRLHGLFSDKELNS